MTTEQQRDQDQRDAEQRNRDANQDPGQAGKVGTNPTNPADAQRDIAETRDRIHEQNGGKNANDFDDKREKGGDRDTTGDGVRTNVRS